MTGGKITPLTTDLGGLHPPADRLTGEEEKRADARRETRRSRSAWRTRTIVPVGGSVGAHTTLAFSHHPFEDIRATSRRLKASPDYASIIYCSAASIHADCAVLPWAPRLDEYACGALGVPACGSHALSSRRLRHFVTRTYASSGRGVSTIPQGDTQA